MFDANQAPGAPASATGQNGQRKDPVPYPARQRMQLTKPMQAMNFGARTANTPAQTRNRLTQQVPSLLAQQSNPADIFAQAGDLAPQAGSEGVDWATLAQSLGMTPEELQAALTEIFASQEKSAYSPEVTASMFQNGSFSGNGGKMPLETPFGDVFTPKG